MARAWDRPSGSPLDGLIEDFIRSQVIGRGLDDRTEKAYRLDLEHFSRWLAREDRAKGTEGAEAGISLEEAGLAEKSPGEREPEKRERQKGVPKETEAGGAARGETVPEGVDLVGADLEQKVQRLEQKVQRYLYYLSIERKLRTSTISRKGRVFRYFLTYLAQTGQGAQDHAPERVSGIHMPERASGTYAPERVGGIHTPERVSRAHTPEKASGAHVSERAGLGEGRESAFGRCACVAAAPLSKKEIDAFFRTIQREMEELDSDFRRRVCLRDLVMMELLFYHGIEVSELLRLRVPDYDRKTGVLTVRRKRGGDRQIYLYSKVLRERMERWLMEHGGFEREAEYREMMFLSKLGRPLSMKMVINIFEKYRERAGIEKAVTPKDLKGSMGAYARELMREVCG